MAELSFVLGLMQNPAPAEVSHAVYSIHSRPFMLQAGAPVVSQCHRHGNSSDLCGPIKTSACCAPSR